MGGGEYFQITEIYDILPFGAGNTVPGSTSLSACRFVVIALCEATNHVAIDKYESKRKSSNLVPQNTTLKELVPEVTDT